MIDQAVYPEQGFASHLKQMRGSDGWKQGDHVLITAPTNAGKTTLASKLLPIRSHAVMLVTKLDDPTFAREFKDWERITSWPKHGPKAYQTRLLLWPKQGKTLAETREIQKEVMLNALNAIALQGKRTVCVDEAIYMCEPQFLGLSREIGMMHYFGRSAGITMVTLAQRPAWVPKIIFSSVTHSYVARTYDKDDAKRLSDFGGVNAKELAANVTALKDRRDYVYVNPQGDASPSVINSRR
jgi:hypothetical protein